MRNPFRTILRITSIWPLLLIIVEAAFPQEQYVAPGWRDKLYPSFEEIAEANEVKAPLPKSITDKIELEDYGLKAGAEINASNFEQYKQLLAEELWFMFQDSDKQYKVRVFPTVDQRVHPKHWENSLNNVGKTKIALTGELIGYSQGFPFPELREADNWRTDRQAGEKLGWNLEYRADFESWHYSYSWFWISSGGKMERNITADCFKLYYNGRTLSDIGVPEFLPNPEKIRSREMVMILKPYDLTGTGFIKQRHQDTKEKDICWVYVPSLRRVRQTSADTTQDAYLGSDVIIDDFQGYAGRATENTFKILEKRIMLQPCSHTNTLMSFGGGPWRFNAIDPAFELQPTYIVEALPKDPDYVYSKRILHISPDTYYVYNMFTYDRKEEYWRCCMNFPFFSEEYRLCSLGDANYMDVKRMHTTQCPGLTYFKKDMTPDFVSLSVLKKGGH